MFQDRGRARGDAVELTSGMAYRSLHACHGEPGSDLAMDWADRNRTGHLQPFHQLLAQSSTRSQQLAAAPRYAHACFAVSRCLLRAAKGVRRFAWAICRATSTRTRPPCLLSQILEHHDRIASSRGLLVRGDDVRRASASSIARLTVSWTA